MGGRLFPPGSVTTKFDRLFAECGITVRGYGSVCNLYDLPGYPNYFLRLPTMRISAKNCQLSVRMVSRPYILNAAAIYGALTVPKDIKTDLVAYGAQIDDFLPAPLHGNRELQKLATIREYYSDEERLPVEAVVRYLVTGNMAKAWSKGEPYCGYEPVPGWYPGCKLPAPIFTPTEKSEGDEPINIETVRHRYFGLEEWVLGIFWAGVHHLTERNIILVDTKYELAKRNGVFVLIDEIHTFDSSRFWESNKWWRALSRGTIPDGLFDKDIFRLWLGEQQLPDGRLMKELSEAETGDPRVAEAVLAMTVPTDLIARADVGSQIGLEAMMGKRLNDFWQEDMRIVV